MSATSEKSSGERRRVARPGIDFSRQQTGQLTSDRPRGQSLVEVAIALPFLLILFLGMVEVVYYMHATITVHNTAREAARVGAKESPYDTKPINDWATLVISNVVQSATASYLSPTSADDTVVVTRITADDVGSLTYCESQSANWPADSNPGPDSTRFSCSQLQTMIAQMPGDLGSSFEDDDFIIVEYFHHHYPIIGLTVVAPDGVTLYSYSAMRIIGQ